MNLFKRPKYLLMILLASISLATFAPHFVNADDGNYSADQAAKSEAAAEASGVVKKADDGPSWIAIQLGHVVYQFTIRFPSVILFQEINLFRLIGTYNGFTTEPQVAKAWSTVRDLANMFFILILLLMSFGTILQIPGYGYRQLLSRLLLMAILINFSKSIVAILIDFSQIITLTFLAPVFNNIGGNLEAALGLSNIMQLPSNPSGTYTGTSFLSAMILGGIMMIITTVIIGVILAMFLMRVVAFWILVILSPMAYLAKAFPKTAQYYTKWETGLSSNLTLGPGLAFFIWLAFSIVGQGNINSSFSKDIDNKLQVDGLGSLEEDTNLVTSVSKAATTANLLNFVVGIALLMAGLKFAAASGAAGASFAGKASGNLQKWGSRIGRGATVGAAVGAGALAWRGTSGEGGVKGGLSWTKSAAGRGMVKVGDNLNIGALQRGGLSMQAPETARRQRKQAKFDKRFENMTAEQDQKYNESLRDGFGFLGKREAKARLANSELAGRASIDPARAKQMLDELTKAGDYKAVEKLRSRSMAVNSVESLDKTLAETGDLRFIGKMNPAGMSADQAKWLLRQDPKMLSGTIDSMSKEAQKEIMDTFANLSDSGQLAGNLTDTKSEKFRASILRAKFAGGDINTTTATHPTSGIPYATLADSYKGMSVDEQKKFVEELRKSITGDQILKIDNNSDLYKDMIGQANAGQRTQMKDKATDQQMTDIVQNQIRFGNIQMVMKDSVFGPVAQAGHTSDIDKFFAKELKNVTNLADKMLLANKHVEYGHKIFDGDQAGLHEWARTLKLEDIIKIGDKKTIDDIAKNAKLGDAMRDALYSRGYGNKPAATQGNASSSSSASGGASTSGPGAQGRP